MELRKVIARFTMLRINRPRPTLKSTFEPDMPKYKLYCSSTDSYLEFLITEEGSKKDLNLHRYFKNPNNVKSLSIYSFENTISTYSFGLKNCSSSEHNVDIISQIEEGLDIKGDKNIPNSKLHQLLSYFVKNGDINGVKVIQVIIKNNNIKHFKLYSEYKHYLAEALWINGKIEDSLELFSCAYDNVLVRPKVIVMLKCLFPLLISDHSEVLLFKAVYFIEKMTLDKNDLILLAYIWKELFLSDWFSDQQLSKQILEKNPKLLNLIQFMIPNMGTMLLKKHKIETFYRVLEFTLEKKFKKDELLIRLLFDYYYLNQNLERCSAVVKYTENYPVSPLTEEQQSRYVRLLVKGRRSSTPPMKPQHLKFKF